MLLLSEIVEELSITNMSAWYGISGSVCYESIYDDTSSTNIIGTLSMFPPKNISFKYMWNITWESMYSILQQPNAGVTIMSPISATVNFPHSNRHDSLI